MDKLLIITWLLLCAAALGGFWSGVVMIFSEPYDQKWYYMMCGGGILAVILFAVGAML